MTLRDKRITFIGAGNMASAIIRGLCATDAVPVSNITAVDLDPRQLDTLRKELGVEGSSDMEAPTANADVIILAVKPQIVTSLLPAIGKHARADALIVSIAAGVTLTTLAAELDDGARVIRTMPNTPALVGEAATAICKGTHATSEDLQLVVELFETVGTTVTVPEKLIDAVTGLSGSGPAYVFLFLEALADGGVRNGLPRDVALKLAAQTVRGAATLMRDTADHPGVLKDRVTSPGGTTIAGVHTLEAGGLRGTVIDAVCAATERSKALGTR